jgi:GNAT superfamily N-acetyltransferase
MAQLRPHLVADDFIARVRGMQREGFHLAYVEDAGAVRAVAGYRYYDKLFSGRNLYVDDLVTMRRSASRGVGARLLRWLSDEARSHGCVQLELDSGVQRFDAHRFYFRERMHVSAYHFVAFPLPLVRRVPIGGPQKSSRQDANLNRNPEMKPPVYAAMNRPILYLIVVVLLLTAGCTSTPTTATSLEPKIRAKVEKGTIEPGSLPRWFFLALGKNPVSPRRVSSTRRTNGTWVYNDFKTTGRDPVKAGFRARLCSIRRRRRTSITTEPIDLKGQRRICGPTLSNVTFREGRVVEISSVVAENLKAARGGLVLRGPPPFPADCENAPRGYDPRRWSPQNPELKEEPWLSKLPRPMCGSLKSTTYRAAWPRVSNRWLRQVQTSNVSSDGVRPTGREPRGIRDAAERPKGAGGRGESRLPSRANRSPR